METDRPRARRRRRADPAAVLALFIVWLARAAQRASTTSSSASRSTAQCSQRCPFGKNWAGRSSSLKPDPQLVRVRVSVRNEVPIPRRHHRDDPEQLPPAPAPCSSEGG